MTANYNFKTNYLIINHLKRDYVLFFKEDSNFKVFLEDVLNKSLNQKQSIFVKDKGETIINSYFNVPFLKFVLVKVGGNIKNERFPESFLGSENEETEQVYFDSLWGNFPKKFFKSQKSYYASSFSVCEKAKKIYVDFLENKNKEEQKEEKKENLDLENVKVGGEL